MSLCGALSALLLAGVANSAPAQRLPDGFFPESLAIAADGSMYAGSATFSSIVRIAPDAHAATAFIAPGSGGLMSVQGLLADDASGQLYACSADLGVANTAVSSSALLAFGLADGKLRGRWELPGGGFCNDLARSPDGRLFISDTGRPRVLAFDPTTTRLTVWQEHPLLGGAPFNGNGIAIDGAKLYLSTFSDGRLLHIPILADGSAGVPAIVPLPRPLAGADALRVLSPGRLVVFENDIGGGNGKVTLITPGAGRAGMSSIAEGLDEPVSGVYRDGALVVVESQFRKLFGSLRGTRPTPFTLRTVRVPALSAALASIALPAAVPYPNGVATGADGSLYVGSITQGGVHRRATDGSWSQLLAQTPEVYAATSLRLDARRGRLWGASPDFLPGQRAPRPHRIFSVDVKNGRLRDALPLPDGGFGNDIALTPKGDVLVTDSKHGRVLRLDAIRRSWTILADGDLLKPVDGIGAAGIARGKEGRLIIGNFGAGKLAVLEGGKLREMKLPRMLDNPDGLAFAPDGALLVIEAALQSGDGKVVRIAEPFAPGRRAIEVLANGLDSPVNVSIGPNGKAYISESRIRALLSGPQQASATNAFRIIDMTLPK